MSLFAATFSVLIHLNAVSSDAPPYCDDGYPIIIVGSGLAGHAAAAEALSILESQKRLESHPIVIFEKESRFGGNSMKATSGINGANSDFQSLSAIDDDAADFSKDTFYSSIGGRANFEGKDVSSEAINPRIRTLTASSGDAVNWLKDRFDLNLNAITQCGGHSRPRTHRTEVGPVGNIIVTQIHIAIDRKVEWRYDSEVVELLMDTESKTVVGVRYKDPKSEGVTRDLLGRAVILTAGGFGNDHTASSLLDEYSRNNEERLPTTNGPWATGDGVKMGQRIGARLVDMAEIQVHPTGFVNPKKRDDSTKFLAPEALRGSGGVMLNGDGRRFVNELDLRSKVVEEMRTQQNMGNTPFRLLMNDDMRRAFGENMGFYIKFGLFAEYENLRAMAEGIGADEAVLRRTVAEYAQSAEDGHDAFGKTVFPNGKGLSAEQTVYVAEITPVIHYTMGGLAVDEKARIHDVNDDVIGGLFGAGEVTGGVHGKNRLAGNSLLECVVYGRIAARNALQHCDDANAHKTLHSEL